VGGVGQHAEHDQPEAEYDEQHGEADRFLAVLRRSPADAARENRESAFAMLVLLVANGNKLTFVDYQVGQKSSWPLGRTPLGVLLSGSPNLNGRAQVMPSNDPRVVVVRARDPSQFGTLVLAFLREPSAPGGLMMYGWTAIDAQNKKTTVKLTNQRYNVAVPDGAFTFAEPTKREKK